MTSQDRGYTVLLSHLHNTTSKLPLSTIQGALAHYLATTSPLPTPLAATAITSPFYLSQPFTHEKLQSFSVAFRHATHLKFRALVDAAKTRSKIQTLLGRSMQTALSQWVTEVLQGLYGGHPVLRLASCSGLLLGVEDIRIGNKAEKQDGVDVGAPRFAVEDETVVALAEVMDTYAYGFGAGSSSTGVEEWEKEFQPAGQDILSLALIFASQSLPLVTESKVKALPLTVLARLLTSTISSTFKAGTFLSSVSASVTLSGDHQVHISKTSPLAQTLQSLSSSPLTISIASISRLTANVLALLIDEPSSRRLGRGMETISESLEVLQGITKQIERDWISCPLASVTDNDIAPDSKEITKSIWLTLKTMLFSTIILTESVLSSCVYLPPGSSYITPSSIALQVLNIMSHLSFVISEFGGVTTTTQGFEHLQRTFYLALDVLAQGDSILGDAGLKAEAYVQQACFALNSQRVETAAASPRQAKQAFVLASIEQLVPVLSDKCIRDWVWGICYPHLSDPSHRETYESAHSVILAIFAAHAQRQQQSFASEHSSEATQTADEATIATSKQRYSSSQPFTAKVISCVIKTGSENKGKDSSRASEDSNVSATFVKRMVPFYSRCLIENSADGKLNTSQLRLAYSALVRGASASAFTAKDTPDDSYALAWYCVQMLLDTIHELAPASSGSKGKNKARVDNAETVNRLHRLHLTLISTISSLPLPLMLRALNKIRVLLIAYPPDDVNDLKSASAGQGEGEGGTKTELVEALYSELLEKTGDREKEAAIRWWYKYRHTFAPEPAVKERRGSLLSWLQRSPSREIEVARSEGTDEESLPGPTQSRL